MKYKIALVIPYFGKFNNQFELFLKSCSKNPTIMWFIFTDDKYQYDYPPNVIVNYMSFSELKNKIQSFYDFDISLSTPYDLCDFKVAYGEIFKEYLKEYDFWGYCDIDVIFGNVRKFITDDILETFDKILIRGHFTLFRNTKYINSLYRSDIDGEVRYKSVFSESGTHHFDEGLPNQVKGINRIFNDQKIEIYDQYIFADIAVNRYAFIQADNINDDEERAKSKHSVFAWENGSLYRYYLENNSIQNEEFMYIHLQKREMENKLLGEPNRFIISPNKFTTWTIITPSLLRKHNRNRYYFSFKVKQWNKRVRKVISYLNEITK